MNLNIADFRNQDNIGNIILKDIYCPILLKTGLNFSERFIKLSISIFSKVLILLHLN